MSARSLALETTGSLIVSSPERKAIETLSLATGLPAQGILRHPDLGEVRRVEAVDEGFHARRSDWVAGRLDARHEGWETPEEAATRFERALTSFGDAPLVIGTHGMVLTAWAAWCGLVPGGEGAAVFWRGLRMPDALLCEDGVLRRV